MRLTGLRSSDTRTGEPVATRPRRRAWIGVAAAVMALASGWGAATAQAATTSVFYNDINNLAADPFPFGSLTFGAGNIAVGQNMMSSLTSGNHNIGVGFNALRVVTTGDRNVAYGENTLADITTVDETPRSARSRSRTTCRIA